MSLWRYLFHGERENYIPNWTPERAEQAHKATMRMLGRGETVYSWSAKVKALKQKSAIRRAEWWRKTA